MANWAHYLPTYVEEEHLSAALEFALATANKAKTGLTIAVNNKGGCTFLTDVLGQPALNKLRIPNTVTIKGVAVSLESTQTLDRFSTCGTVLAVHASSKLLEILDSIEEKGDVIVIAEARDVDANWLEERGSRPLKSQ